MPLKPCAWLDVLQEALPFAQKAPELRSVDQFQTRNAASRQPMLAIKVVAE